MILRLVLWVTARHADVLRKIGQHTLTSLRNALRQQALHRITHEETHATAKKYGRGNNRVTTIPKTRHRPVGVRHRPP